MSPSLQPLDLAQCKASFEVEPHDEYPRVLEHIILTITYPFHQPKTVVHSGDFSERIPLARLTAIHIRPYAANAEFLAIMDSESDELQHFGLALFDRYGRIKSSLVGGNKGNGCWGAELNRQDIMYVLDVEVDPNVRGKGVGSWALKALVESQYVQESDFVIAWPTPTGGTRDPAEWEVLKARQIAFFRKNGFRRVAHTPFFAFSPSPIHPSRQIPSSEDYDPPKFPTEPPLTPEDRKSRFPVHILVATEKSVNVNNILRNIYAANPNSISTRDENGYSPIWIAAAAGNLHAARSLISLLSLTHPLPAVHPDLTNRLNDVCLTPLEKASERMRSEREFSETLLQTWAGYTEDDLMLEVLLKRAMGMDVLERSNEEYVGRRKWGCTCGHCDDGWMSKRMRFRLRCQAELQVDYMNHPMFTFVRGKPLFFDDIEIEIALPFIPPHLHSQIFKSFYTGYQAVFRGIAHILSQPPTIPFPSTVNRPYSLNPAADFYFRKGGKVEYALACLMHSAEEQSDACGDGTFEEMWAEDEEYLGLGVCANDNDYGLVRMNLGLDPRIGWGPYGGEEVGMDSSSDGD